MNSPYRDINMENLVFYDASLPPLPGKIAPCMMCGKAYLVRPYIGTVDQVCGECFTTFSDTARIVCARCNATIARVRPSVTDSGYYVRPREVLHVDACNVCKVGIVVSSILEIVRWEQTLRRPKVIVGPYGRPV